MLASGLEPEACHPPLRVLQPSNPPTPGEVVEPGLPQHRTMHPTVKSLLPILSLVSSVSFAAAPAPASASGGAQETKISVQPAPASADPRLTFMNAMALELGRNFTQLKQTGHAAPYFISYQIKDYENFSLDMRYGAVFDENHNRDRKIYTDVRVGNYDFDNSLDEGMDFSFSMKGQSYLPKKDAPIDDDPMALRTALWLVTDERYKSAVYNYLKKKGENIYTVDDPQRPPSFSQEEPTRFVQPPLKLTWDRERWAKLGRELTAQLRDRSEFFDSSVRVTAEKVTRYLTTTEGTRLITEDMMYAFHLQVLTRTDDGQLLENARDFYSPTEAGMPTDARLREATDEMVRELLELRVAPQIDPYTGPAILAPVAAGTLFHEAVGHRLEGERQDNSTEGKTFKGQIGKPMLPTFLSVVDDPTLRDVDGVAINGFYVYDEEGVKGQKTVLVEDGVLKSFLVSRHPIEGFLKSNGHGRSQANRQPVARMANLVVKSKRTVSDEQLKMMLIDEAKRQGKPYGLLIRDITGGNTNTSSYGYQAFKGMPRMVYRVDVKTGKESLVRGVEIVGTPLTAMNKILATGSKPGVFNGFCGAESGYVPVSTVAPATLLQEIELQRVMEGKDRSQILPSPAIEEQRKKKADSK